MTRCRIKPRTRERNTPTPTETAPERRPSSTRVPPARSVNVVVGRVDAERAARFLHQIRLDEPVDVAVEHTIHVADLLLGPMVLHELVRMQHVAADLAAEGDLFLRAA